MKECWLLYTQFRGVESAFFERNDYGESCEKEDSLLCIDLDKQDMFLVSKFVEIIKKTLYLALLDQAEHFILMYKNS